MQVRRLPTADEIARFFAVPRADYLALSVEDRWDLIEAFQDAYCPWVEVEDHAEPDDIALQIEARKVVNAAILNGTLKFGGST